MIDLDNPAQDGKPARCRPPHPLSALLFALFLGFFLWSLSSAGISIGELIAGLPNRARIGAEMVPPATDRLEPMLRSVLVTFQMAVVGTGFSAECADAATLATHGIADVTDLLGRPVPSVYSAELSELVLAAGVTLLEQQGWDLMYLSTTDYIQNKHAPGTPPADAFYTIAPSPIFTWFTTAPWAASPWSI